MSFLQIIQLLRQRVMHLVLTSLLCAALAMAALILVQPRYSSSMDLLLVQADTSGQDFYTAFKSAEYLGKVLAQAMYSERFITEVIATGKMSDRFLPLDKKDRLEAWGEMISVRNNLELGIISVSVEGQNDRDTARIMDGVAEVLTQKNALFRSGDEKSVEVRVLSGPILETQPTLKKILMTVVSGFFLGLFLSSLLALMKNQTRRFDA